MENCSCLDEMKLKELFSSTSFVLKYFRLRGLKGNKSKASIITLLLCCNDGDVLLFVKCFNASRSILVSRKISTKKQQQRMRQTQLNNKVFGFILQKKFGEDCCEEGYVQESDSRSSIQS